MWVAAPGVRVTRQTERRCPQRAVVSIALTDFMFPVPFLCLSALSMNACLNLVLIIAGPLRGVARGCAVSLAHLPAFFFATLFAVLGGARLTFVATLAAAGFFAGAVLVFTVMSGSLGWAHARRAVFRVSVRRR